MRLYSICRPMKELQPRKSAMVFARDTTQAGASEMPAYKIFPARTKSSKARMISSRKKIPDVKPVEVDVIRLEPLQAGVNGLQHTLAVIAGRVGIRAGHGIGVLGGEDDATPIGAHELAEIVFAGAIGVQVGGVDEVTTGFQKCIVNRAAFFF